MTGAAEGEEKWGVKAQGERVEREPIMGVWGRAPSGVQGQSPLVRGQSPSEAETFLPFGRSLEAANLSTLLKIWKCKKITDICVVFAKMKFNKLRYGTD